MLLIFCSVFTNWLITFSSFLFRFLLVDFGSFHSRFDNVINDSFNYTVTIHRWNCPELKYRIFRSALALVACLFMFLLIFNAQRVLKFTFVLVLTYYVNHSLEGAPHLFVILTAIGWFIVNIQSDLFWHRCLERQTFCTPWMYTLSPSKSIKGSNYGEFLKDKMYCYINDCASTLRIWKVCLHSNMYA